MLAVIPIVSYLLFQSLHIVIWTFLVFLIFLRLSHLDSPPPSNNEHNDNNTNDKTESEWADANPLFVELL